MLLRRMTEGLRRQDWTSVVIELLILTVGVFLGLQAESWNQNRKDRAESQRYAARLIEDFSTIRNRSVEALEELEREAAALSHLSRITLSNEGDGRSDSSLSEAARELIGTNALPPARPASFIEMLESNNLGLIEDRTLVDSIIRCDNRIQEFSRDHATRSTILLDRGAAWLDFLLDSIDLSPREALNISSEKEHELRRGRALAERIRTVEKGSFQSILECSDEIIQRLTAGT